MSCSQSSDTTYCGKDKCSTNWKSLTDTKYKDRLLECSIAGSQYKDNGYYTTSTVAHDDYVRKCARNVTKSQTDCCFGNYSDPNECPKNYCQDSTACTNYLTTYCQDPTNFFGTKCQVWINNLGTNKLKDTIAYPICSNDTYKDEPECGCYSIDFEADLDDNIKGPAMCIDPKCQDSRAIKPATFDPHACNFNNVVCINEGNQTALYDQGRLTYEEIKNQCGITNTYVSDPNASSVEEETTTDTNGSNGTDGTNGNDDTNDDTSGETNGETSGEEVVPEEQNTSKLFGFSLPEVEIFGGAFGIIVLVICCVIITIILMVIIF